MYSHVCTSAGSSASDTNDIGFKEAERRLSLHGKLQLKMGASCFYTNNTINSTQNAVSSLLNNKSIGTIYFDFLKKNQLFNNNKNLNECFRFKKVDKNTSLFIYKRFHESNCESIVQTSTNGIISSKKVKCFPSYGLAFYGDSSTLLTKPTLQISKKEPEPEPEIINEGEKLNSKFIEGRWKAKKEGLLIINPNGVLKYKGKNYNFTVFEKVIILKANGSILRVEYKLNGKKLQLIIDKENIIFKKLK